VPVYKLLGGKVRTAVPLYGHASARDFSELEDQVRKWMSQGYRHVRVQLAVPGFAGYGVQAETSPEVEKMRPAGIPPSPVFEPTPYVNNTIKMFEQLRARLGFDVELLHDIHERLPPNQAIQLCKAVEPYRPFFMEDPFPRKMSPGSAFSDSRPLARLPWVNSSSTATSGFSLSPSDSSTSFGSTSRPWAG
jgi:mannonate dehydratase